VCSAQEEDVERHIAYLRSNLGAQADAAGFHVSRYPCTRLQASAPNLLARAQSSRVTSLTRLFVRQVQLLH
jgi:hypothetical protein